MSRAGVETRLRQRGALFRVFTSPIAAFGADLEIP